MAERRFGRFVVEPGRRRLLIEGEPVKIGARAFDVLPALIERRKRVVGKNELLQIAWPQATVEEGTPQVQIFALRQPLGAGAITTIPGRGRQFSAAIAAQALGGAEFERLKGEGGLLSEDEAVALAIPDGKGVECRAVSVENPIRTC